MRFPARCSTALLVFLAACGDGPIEPPTAGTPVRTILFHRQDTGENLLLNSDGTRRGVLVIPGGRTVPLGVSVQGRVAAVVRGGLLGVVALDAPARFDTVLAIPSVISLVSFSPDAQSLALVAYSPFRGVLLFNRADRRLDTLDYGSLDAVLPPVFSPDGARLAVISQSELSLFSTVLTLATPDQRTSARFGFSKFLTIPVFGWPRWTDEGLLMAFVREGGDAPDTLLSARLDPADPGDFVQERFRVVLSPVSDARPEIVFGDFATYAYSLDGDVLVIGADPGTGAMGRHALYLATRGVARIQLLLDDPAQVPVFPNFVN